MDSQVNNSLPPSAPSSPAPHDPPPHVLDTHPSPRSQTLPLSSPRSNNAIPLRNDDDGSSKRPRDARLLHMVLANMGIKSYEPRVVLQLLDFAYRYTSAVLADAQQLAGEVVGNNPASNATVNNARGGGAVAGEQQAQQMGVGQQAVRLAAAAQPMNRASNRLGKEFWFEEAKRANAVALPVLGGAGGGAGVGGVRLPPVQYCMTGTPWTIMTQVEDEEEDDEDDEDGGARGLEDEIMGEGERMVNGHAAAEVEAEDEDMEDIDGGGRMEDLFGEEPTVFTGNGGGGLDGSADPAPDLPMHDS